jgi:hypothetical protein
MAALSERNIGIVRTLVSTAPDAIVGGLQQALAGASEASALGSVRRLVETEAAERILRNRILGPIVPLCVGDRAGPRALSFPWRVLPLLWDGLRQAEGGAIESVRDLLSEDGPPQVLAEACDKLTEAAARLYREGELEPFRAAAAACLAARPEAAEELAGCLDLAPIVRRATERMHEWLTYSNSETAAAARLAFKDAVQVDDDAGPRFFRILATHLPQPWMILRIISAVMDKPTERYLADSELASFGEQVLDDVDRLLNRVAALDPDAGPEAAREAAGLVELAVQQVREIEDNIDLQREYGWGLRLHKQRAELAGVAERRFTAAEKAAVDALPMQKLRAHRASRPAPCLDTPPEPRAARRATTLLTFADAVQVTAAYGGFTSARARFVESLGGYLDNYVEEVIDRVRLNEVPDREVAAGFLDLAAGFDELLRGPKAGELVRRRASAALHPEAAQAAQR